MGSALATTEWLAARGSIAPSDPWLLEERTERSWNPLDQRTDLGARELSPLPGASVLSCEAVVQLLQTQLAEPRSHEREKSAGVNEREGIVRRRVERLARVGMKLGDGALGSANEHRVEVVQ